MDESMMHICLWCGESREGSLPTYEENEGEDGHQHEWVTEEQYQDQINEWGQDARVAEEDEYRPFEYPWWTETEP
jgi:hypothetical protein